MCTTECVCDPITFSFDIHSVMIQSMFLNCMYVSLYVSELQPSLPAEGIRHIVLWETEEVKKKRLFTILNDRRIFRLAG